MTIKEFNSIRTEGSASGTQTPSSSISRSSSSSCFCSPCAAVYPLPSAAYADHNGLSPRQIKSDSDDDDLPNVTLDSVNETGSTALSIARAVQE